MSYFTVFDLYAEDEVEKILASLPEGWQKGQARTPELTDLVKDNQELQAKDSDIVKALCQSHARRLAGLKAIKAQHLIKGVSPPKLNRYTGGGTYKRHTDSPVMAGCRTDLACTTFFTEGYEGGELNVEDQYGIVHSIKGKIGQAVIYPCGQPHWVSPVTSGERISIICWMQSYVRDLHKRGLLAQMIRSLQKIEPLSLEDEKMREVWTELGAVHADLFRMWME